MTRHLLKKQGILRIMSFTRNTIIQSATQRCKNCDNFILLHISNIIVPIELFAYFYAEILQISSILFYCDIFNYPHIVSLIL